MPLLPLEAFVWPQELLAQPLPLDDKGRWWALHSRPRAEKALARHFLGRGLAFFFPWLRNAGEIAAGFSPRRPRFFPGTSFCGAMRKLE